MLSINEIEYGYRYEKTKTLEEHFYKSKIK